METDNINFNDSYTYTVINYINDSFFGHIYIDSDNPFVRRGIVTNITHNRSPTTALDAYLDYLDRVRNLEDVVGRGRVEIDEVGGKPYFK